MVLLCSGETGEPEKPENPRKSYTSDLETADNITWLYNLFPTKLLWNRVELNRKSQCTIYIFVHWCCTYLYVGRSICWKTGVHIIMWCKYDKFNRRLIINLIFYALKQNFFNTGAVSKSSWNRLEAENRSLNVWPLYVCSLYWWGITRRCFTVPLNRGENADLP